MDSIVEHGLKIDLHIHSCASAPKDGNKVKNNTFENIPLLVSKLNENGVNICAITDHDTFSLAMYSELKKAELDISSIKKVLPGVEFSVSFLDRDNKEQIIHVVTIFSDKESDKVSKIETVLEKYRPESSGAYTEESFLKVLRKIDLDTILVAHQKNTLSSKKPRKNDVNSLGETTFLELVASDYFEAYYASICCQMKMILLFTTSITLALIPFIFRTHSMGFSVLLQYNGQLFFEYA